MGTFSKAMETLRRFHGTATDSADIRRRRITEFHGLSGPEISSALRKCALRTPIFSEGDGDTEAIPRRNPQTFTDCDSHLRAFANSRAGVDAKTIATESAQNSVWGDFGVILSRKGTFWD